MRKLLFFLFSLLSLHTFSHPGIGIVKDRKGNIYYTDLENVWKINPQTLAKTIAVHNVHTHELYMDANDNLFGQHSMYSGEQTNTWSYYVWKLDSKGKLDTVIPVTDGFYIKDFSFVGDKKGNQYWIQHFTTDKIIKKHRDGNSEVLLEGDLKNVQWMFPLNDKLFYVKEDDIFVIDKPGSARLFAENLNGKIEGGHNSIYGLWLDKVGNSYVANSDLKRVQKLDSLGKPTNFYQSETNWFPTGGLFDGDGNLWVLECSTSNEVRVQKIGQNKLMNHQTQTPKKGSSNFVFLIAGVILIMAIMVVVGKRKTFN